MPKDYYSPEEALLLVRNTETFINQGAFTTALKIADLLVRNISAQMKSEDRDMLVLLIHALYLKGFALSIAENNPPLALKDFEEMERLASEIGDQTWLCVALMYQGEMYRRIGEHGKALLIFKRAIQGSDVDSRVIGNCQQLLARLYVALNNIGDALTAIGKAEEHALVSQEQRSNLLVFFDLCSVYIDYAAIYMKLGNTNTSLKYLAESEKLVKNGKTIPYWLAPIMVFKGEILMNVVAYVDVRASESVLNNPDYLEGARLVIEGYKLAREYSDQRLVDHAHSVVNKFGERASRNSMIAQDLGEKLYDA